MAIGFLGSPVLCRFSFLTTYLLFIMLFLSFVGAGVTLRSLKPTSLHIKLLAAQLTASPAVYLCLQFADKTAAEAIAICVICPTAVASAVITGRLGGSVSGVASYTVLSNGLIAVVAPVVFPLIEPLPNLDFAAAFFLILAKIFCLLIAPLICAAALRRFAPKFNDRVRKISFASFYVWALSLVLLTAQIADAVFNARGLLCLEIAIAVAAFVLCLLQFGAGRLIGKKYNDSITAGQALGQKNTIFALWMASEYLQPLAALGPGCYMIWQNIINALQIFRKAKAEEASYANAEKDGGI